MEISRDPSSIQNVGGFMTLVKDAEKKGKFFCKGCGKILNSLVMSVPNDGKDHTRPCPHCGALLYFNSGWLAAKILEARELAKAGINPKVEPCKQPGGMGGTREEPLPDGRKRIIVTPIPAVSSAGAK